MTFVTLVTFVCTGEAKQRGRLMDGRGCGGTHQNDARGRRGPYALDWLGLRSDAWQRVCSQQHGGSLTPPTAARRITCLFGCRRRRDWWACLLAGEGGGGRGSSGRCNGRIRSLCRGSGGHHRAARSRIGKLRGGDGPRYDRGRLAERRCGGGGCAQRPNLELAGGDADTPE